MNKAFGFLMLSLTLAGCETGKNQAGAGDVVTSNGDGAQSPVLSPLVSYNVSAVIPYGFQIDVLPEGFTTEVASNQNIILKGVVAEGAVVTTTAKRKCFEDLIITFDGITQDTELPYRPAVPKKYKVSIEGDLEGVRLNYGPSQLLGCGSYTLVAQKDGFPEVTSAFTVDDSDLYLRFEWLFTSFEMPELARGAYLSSDIAKRTVRVTHTGNALECRYSFSSELAYASQVCGEQPDEVRFTPDDYQRNHTKLIRVRKAGILPQVIAYKPSVAHPGVTFVNCAQTVTSDIGFYAFETLLVGSTGITCVADGVRITSRAGEGPIRIAEGASIAGSTHGGAVFEDVQGGAGVFRITRGGRVNFSAIRAECHSVGCRVFDHDGDFMALSNVSAISHGAEGSALRIGPAAGEWVSVSDSLLSTTSTGGTAGLAASMLHEGGAGVSVFASGNHFESRHGFGLSVTRGGKIQVIRSVFRSESFVEDTYALGCSGGSEITLKESTVRSAGGGVWTSDCTLSLNKNTFRKAFGHSSVVIWSEGPQDVISIASSGNLACNEDVLGGYMKVIGGPNPATHFNPFVSAQAHTDTFERCAP